jgi:CheY-like chemotaxis protein
MVEAHRPDLVLLDLQMPGTDGYEAVRRIRALDGTRDLPVIATSINTGPRIEAAAAAAGFTEFIAKPVSDYGPLKVRIEHWLGPTQPYLAPSAPAPMR